MVYFMQVIGLRFDHSESANLFYFYFLASNKTGLNCSLFWSVLYCYTRLTLDLSLVNRAPNNLVQHALFSLRTISCQHGI